MASQNLVWVSNLVTEGTIPSWLDIICSAEVMAPGFLSEGFLIDPPLFLPLFLHCILWYLPNRQAIKEVISDLPGDYDPLG